MNVVNPGTADASITMAKLATARCLLYKSANQNYNSGAFNALTFDTEVYDTASLHDNATNPSRITVPTGYSFAMFWGGVRWTANNTGSRLLGLLKNGSTDYGSPVVQHPAANADARETDMSVASPILAVTAGDYFELFARQDSGGALAALNNGNTYFACWMFR